MIALTTFLYAAGAIALCVIGYSARRGIAAWVRIRAELTEMDNG